MIDGGYILQPRKVDSSSIMHAPPVVRELWLYLLRKVNHKDNGVCSRGEGFFRLEDVQNDLCWYVGYRKMMYSKPQLTKSLRRLREELTIATTKETRGVRVTVLNYDVYQNPKNYEGNDEESAKEIVKIPTGRTINKNVKNERMKEENTPLPPLPETREYPAWLNRKLWGDFRAWRSEIGRPLSIIEESTALEQLRAFKELGQDIDAVIRQSITQQWKGFFPVRDIIKTGGRKMTPRQQQMRDIADMRNAIEERENGTDFERCPGGPSETLLSLSGGGT